VIVPPTDAEQSDCGADIAAFRFAPVSLRTRNRGCGSDKNEVLYWEFSWIKADVAALGQQRLFRLNWWCATFPRLGHFGFWGFGGFFSAHFPADVAVGLNILSSFKLHN